MKVVLREIRMKYKRKGLSLIFTTLLILFCLNSVQAEAEIKGQNKVIEKAKTGYLENLKTVAADKKKKKKKVKLKWDTDLKVGDRVCIYDIANDDPLHSDDSVSFMYWYRAREGRQEARYELRPEIAKLRLKILFPGITPADQDVKHISQQWYSVIALVVKNGTKQKDLKKLRDKGTSIDFEKIGENELIKYEKRTYPMQDQVIVFEKVRFKKDRILGGCERKYE